METIKRGHKYERKESERDRKIEALGNRKEEMLMRDNLLHKLKRAGAQQ
jgi:hypothetical protein